MILRFGLEASRMGNGEGVTLRFDDEAKLGSALRGQGGPLVSSLLFLSRPMADLQISS